MPVGATRLVPYSYLGCRGFVMSGPKRPVYPKVYPRYLF
jgi:hypothetical protein